MKGTDDTVAKGNEETVLCFSFSSIDICTLVTYKLQQHRFMRAVIPVENSFKYAKIPSHFHNLLFVTTGKRNRVYSVS